MFRRTKPDLCEWLKRPNIVMSEFAEAFHKRLSKLDVLCSRETHNVLRGSLMLKFQQLFAGICDHLSSLNTKEGGQPSRQDVKAFLKLVCDDDLDKEINEAEEGHASFLWQHRLL